MTIAIIAYSKVPTSKMEGGKLCWFLGVLNGEVATIAAPLMRSSPHRSKLFTAEETA